MQFKPYGSCIYCDATQDLGKEHIVPYALCAGGSQLVLPKASCKAHGAITSKFEQEVLRGPLWPVRAYLQLKSRHADLAPKTAPIVIGKADGSTMTANVPLSDRPLPLFFPLLHPPSELTGDHAARTRIRGEVTIRFGKGSGEALAREFGATSIRVNQSYRPVQFAQMLGKIAWGLAAGGGQLAHIERTVCVLPALVDDPDAIGRWVGSADAAPTIGPPPDCGDTLHEMIAFERRGYLLYRIQLFASHRTPYYWVVVGKLKAQHPAFPDQIAVQNHAEGASIVEVLRDLQPGTMTATAPSRMTSIGVAPRQKSRSI